MYNNTRYLKLSKACNPHYELMQQQVSTYSHGRNVA